MSLATIERSERGVSLTMEDEAIFNNLTSHTEQYEYAVADRNDAALIAAYDAMVTRGCRAIRDRAMFGGTK